MVLDGEQVETVCYVEDEPGMGDVVRKETGAHEV